MNKSRACFICGTPFHVITSVVLKQQLHIDADIIIYDAFSNIKKLKNNLLEKKVFEDVTVIDREEDFGFPINGNILKRYLFSFWGYFRIKTLVKKNFPDFSKYTDVFFANDQKRDVIDRYVFCYIKKYHEEIKCHFFDDGWGAYNDYFYVPTTLDYLMRRLVVRNHTHINDSDVFLYSTDLFDNINPNHKRIIHPINKIDAKTAQLLSCIFDYIPEISKDYKYIVFDTVRYEDYSEGGGELFDRLVRQLVKDEKTIVKPHPRDNIKYLDLDYFYVEGFPFELLCLKMDFSNTTFINNFSTAVFTPKLLFDQEPRVIFTFEAMGDYLVDKKVDRKRFVYCLRKLYSDEAKIVVLKTIE